MDVFRFIFINKILNYYLSFLDHVTLEQLSNSNLKDEIDLCITYS